MSRKTEILNHANTVIKCFAGKEGIRLFYKIKRVKVQKFEDHSLNYFEWLLAAVPSGYLAEVKTKIRELNPALMKKVSRPVPEETVGITKSLVTKRDLFGAATHERELTRNLPENDR